MCVWYLRVWPLPAWVPARQQMVGSPALRDCLLLLSHFLFYWSGVAVLKAGIRFLRAMLSFLQLLHLRWVICHIVALTCLLVNLLGIGLHHLIDKNSCLVNHCVTSHYSSFCDVQIDRILHTLIIRGPFLLSRTKLMQQRLRSFICAHDVCETEQADCVISKILFSIS